MMKKLLDTLTEIATGPATKQLNESVQVTEDETRQGPYYVVTTIDLVSSQGPYTELRLSGPYYTVDDANAKVADADLSGWGDNPVVITHAEWAELTEDGWLDPRDERENDKLLWAWKRMLKAKVPTEPEPETEFDKADKKVHPVETQWHYPIMTKYGYEPQTPTGTGFVRSYNYLNPQTGHQMRLTTGANADYWTDGKTGATGYHRELESHLQKNSVGEAALNDGGSLSESKNHLGDTEYSSYKSWKAACKKASAAVWFDGDQDIGQAFVGPKPYKKGESKTVGDWDGEVGSVYANAAEIVASVSKKVTEAAAATPDIAVRSLYTKSYAKNGGTAVKAKAAQTAAYAEVEKKYGKAKTDALKAYHKSNLEEGVGSNIQFGTSFAGEKAASKPVEKAESTPKADSPEETKKPMTVKKPTVTEDTGPTVHDFSGEDSRDVYDLTQTDDSIKDGDVLNLGDGNVAILNLAWPVVVTGKINGFHRLADNMTWEKYDGGKYLASVKKAKEVAATASKGVVEDGPKKVDIPAAQRKAKGGDWKVKQKDLDADNEKNRSSTAGLKKFKKESGIDEAKTNYHQVDVSAAKWHKAVLDEFPGAKFQRASEGEGGTLSAFVGDKFVGDWDGSSPPYGRILAKPVSSKKVTESVLSEGGKYWSDQNTNDYDTYWNKLVPGQGAADSLQGELLRAATKIYYDWHNNGFGNNWSGAYQFLYKYGEAAPGDLMLIKPYSQGISPQLSKWEERRLESALDSIMDETLSQIQGMGDELEPNPCDMYSLQQPDDYGDYDEESSDWSEDDLEEAAAPGQEKWIKDHKAEFVKEYGKKKGMEVLYATAWKRSKTNESASTEDKRKKIQDQLDKVAANRKANQATGGRLYPLGKLDKQEKELKSKLAALTESKVGTGVTVILESVKFRVSDPSLAKVLRRFPHEAENFHLTGELDDTLYDALFDHYSTNGEMPYGVMKARVGDPFEWISNKLEQEFATTSPELTEDTESEIETIFAKYPFEAKQFKQTGELDDGPMYEEFYDHFLHSGEMPYEVAKARDGDPVQWVQDKLVPYTDKQCADDYALGNGPKCETTLSVDESILMEEPSEEEITSVLQEAGLDDGLDFIFEGGSLIVFGRSIAKSAITALRNAGLGDPHITSIDSDEVRISFGPKPEPTPPNEPTDDIETMGLDDIDFDTEEPLEIKEDVSINLSATGEEDVLSIIRKLSGMPCEPVITPSVPSIPQIEVIPGIAAEFEEGLEVDTPDDGTYSNEPDQEVHTSTAAMINGGDDLNRSKSQYPALANPAANPMAEARDLMKRFTDIVDGK